MTQIEIQLSDRERDAIAAQVAELLDDQLTSIRDHLANLDSHVSPQVCQHSKRVAAYRLGYSTRYVDELIKSGALACVRVGGSVRISEQAIRDFIRENETRGAGK